MDGIADYTFVRPLSEAGHGTLYLANTPPRLGLDSPFVGVKVIGGADDTDALRRVTRELRAFAAVRSPYLVQLLDAGRDGGSFFYAMEHCPRGSLESAGGEVGRGERLAAVAQAARGAHALHEAGLVHRGIKPSNILLADDGARLADLGLVLLDNGSMTGVGPVSGIEYVDPVILVGGRVTPSSDIWSLGVTLHHALTGTGVYSDLPLQDPLLAVRRVLKQRPTIADGLSVEEANLVSRCLAADPQERPSSALEVAESIEDLLNR